MPGTLTIFVGSTFVDLEPHRAAVLHALQRLEAVARGMEHFGSLPGLPKDECLRVVRGCRAYVGIFAMRYGNIDTETGKSLTELEYEEAQRFQLRSLIYLIDEDQQSVLPKHVDFGERGEKLKQFKSHLKQHHVVSFFTTPEDLAMRVTQDVANLIQDGGPAVEQSALSKIVENLPRADWPDDNEFAFLKKCIGRVADPIGSDVILREALQFILVGDNLSATFLVIRSTQLNVRQAIDLLMKIDKIIDAIARDGNARIEEKRRVESASVSGAEKPLSDDN